METPFSVVENCKVRSVVRFLTAKHSPPHIEIHRKLGAVYGEECMSMQMVQWVKMIGEERKNVHDSERTGRTSDSIVDNNIEAVCHIIESDRRLTLMQICEQINNVADCSRSSVQHIIQELGYRKLTAKSVPRLLSEQQKNIHCATALDFLSQYHNEGSSLIDQIITGYEI
ncbi:hypothetical protein PGB90_002862 [Kerria lacca]